MKKTLTSLLILACSLLSFSAQAENISGYVTVGESGYSFINSSTQKSYELKPANQSTSEDLKKLSNFDSLTGKASILRINSKDVVLLESVDFVGLRRLLGLWKSKGTVLEFVDYNEVSFYFPNNRKKNFKMPTKKTRYRYSVSPTTTDSWRVFFADDDSVVLGSLNIQGSKAVIELYDTETGQTAETYSLEKVNP